MNMFAEKLYYRVQSLYVSLQRKMIARDLGIAGQEVYRTDQLRTMQTIKGCVDKCDVLVDVGANEGSFSRIFCEVYHPSGIICVEPNEGLNLRIQSGNTKPQPVIINQAVSDQEGEMDFFFHPDSQMSSLFPSNKELIQRDFKEDDPDGVIKKMVPITTLDKIFAKHTAMLSGKSVFLKIDTQGNELDVIRGGKTAFSNISYCLLEHMFHSPYEKKYSFEEIVAVMAGYGFECLGPMHSSYRLKGEVGAVLFLFGKKNL